MYGIQKIAEITGIPAVTLRAWERRYHVIRPERTESGSRLYTEENLQDLLWVKQQKEKKKLPVKEAMALLEEAKLKKNNEPDAVLNSYESFIDALYHELVQFKTEAANHILNQALAMYDYELVFHYIVTPVLHKTGGDWEAGRLSVIQEHFISHLLVRRLEMLFQTLETDSSLPRAVALCPPKEQHSIGLMLFALFLKKRGHDVVFLGENTPVEAMDAFIKEQNVRLVTASVTLPEHVETLYAFLKGVQEHHQGIQVILGGKGMKKPPSDELGTILEGGLDAWKSWYKTLF